MFLKNIYKDYKELKKERDYYAHECYLKEERYRNLNKEYKELEKKYEEVLNGHNVIQSTRAKRTTRKQGTSQRGSRQAKEI